MSNKHQRGKRGESRHVRLYHWLMQSPAWQDLSALARGIYVEISKRYNGTNNGFISYSVREASAEFKVSKSTAARALRELEEHGFIAAEQRGAFHWKIDVSGARHRPASEWRLTEHHNDRTVGIESKYPSKNFMRWPEEIHSTVSPQVRMVPVAKPYGVTRGTMSSKNGPDGPCSETIKAGSKG